MVSTNLPEVPACAGMTGNGRQIQNSYSPFVLFVFYSPQRRRFAARARRRKSVEACPSHRSISVRSFGRLRLIRHLHRRAELEDVLTSAIGNDVSTFGLVHSDSHQIYAFVDKALRARNDLETT
jgi:hypothetical protein